jgi:hypothetical protein
MILDALNQVTLTTLEKFTLEEGSLKTNKEDSVAKRFGLNKM